MAFVLLGIACKHCIHPVFQFTRQQSACLEVFGRPNCYSNISIAAVGRLRPAYIVAGF